MIVILCRTKLGRCFDGVKGSIRELMVLFPDAVAEAGRCLAGQAFEEAGKIGGIFETQRIADLLDREVCVEKKPLAFEGDALMDECGGRFARVSAYDVVEVSGADIKQSGIIGYLVQTVVAVIN